MKIVTIVRRKSPTRVYDFTVDTAHHYLLENGVVSHNSYVPTKAMSGGGGLVYVSDSIAMLSKSKVRDKSDKKVIIGADITVRMMKSRLSRENTDTQVRISYSGGLDRYYGLLEMGQAAGMITGGAGGRYTFPGATTSTTSKKIDESPETFFTDEFLKKLDEVYVKPHFSYGAGLTIVEGEESDDDNER